MFTTYYYKADLLKKLDKNLNIVSIAGKAPAWYRGREYKKLAPKHDFFKKYKDDGDEEYYTEQYYKRVLGKLDPTQVFNELGEDAILVCWEEPSKFCHRHLVADWFKKELGIDVLEISKILLL